MAYTAVIPYESLDPLTIGASGDDEKVSRDTLSLEIPDENLLAAIYPDEPAPVADATDAAACFFTRWAEATASFRAHIEIRDVLWGFTQQSQYTRTRSQQELDPFATERLPYLIVYPFVKTRDWYLLPMSERQRIMNEHIAIGHKYPRVKINTTYSFGLDDQDFVVAFESDTADEFLDLVQELRETESSKYTVRDTPMYTCRRAPIEEILDSLG